MIINQPKSDFPLKTKANKRLLPATILGYSQIKFIFSMHVYVKPNQDHLWCTKCGSVQELAALCHQFCLAGGEAHSLDDKLLFSPQIVSWWDVMASRTLANMPGTSLLPEECGEGAGLLAWLKKLRFVCSPCCNTSLPCCGAFLHHLLSVKLFLIPCWMES